MEPCWVNGFVFDNCNLSVLQVTGDICEANKYNRADVK